VKRVIAFLSAIVLLTPLLTFSVCAAENSWYIKHNTEKAQPEIEKTTEKLLEQYDAYYVDKAKKDSTDKVIYLTFDAGYANENVNKVLDILKQEEIKGAFFILSHLIESHPEIVSRIADDGHLLCNHTHKHKDPCKLTEEELTNEIKTLEMQYKNAMGKDLSLYFRPPQGRYDQKTLETAQKMGYKTVFWSLAYVDWDDSIAPSDEKAKALLERRTHNGAIVLLHPTSDINARILKDMIAYWKAQGYRFGSLDELTEK